MKRIVVELSNERLITPSGLTLVGGALGKSDLVKRSNRMTVDKKRSQPQIKNGDILLTYIGLLCQEALILSVSFMPILIISKRHSGSPMRSRPLRHCVSGWI